MFSLSGISYVPTCYNQHMLYTIGYEGTNIDNFLTTLKDSGVTVLVDVRAMPLSRKKGFSKSRLKEAVESAGITYIHLRELGAPKEVRNNLKATGNWQDYVHHYEAYLATQQEALNLLASQAQNTEVCLMCFEADPLTCHRSLISKELENRKAVPKTSHLLVNASFLSKASDAPSPRLPVAYA